MSNRAERARDYFMQNVDRHISKRELAEAGICDFYVIRNACSEAKALLPDGYEIIAERSSEDHSVTCGYRCVKVSGEVQSAVVSSPPPYGERDGSERTRGAEAVNPEPTPSLCFEEKKVEVRLENGQLNWAI